jgi:FkbM family methyltransferase
LSRELGCIVDIGANRGQFALAARHWASNAHVFSFEPLPEPSKKFLQVFNNDGLVMLHQAAIGLESGEATIHISQRDDSSSLLPIGAAQDRLFPGTAEESTEVIRVGPLEEFLSGNDIISPALLKLDVQGFELTALQGCESLLDKFAYVYVECSFLELYEGQALAADVIAWLREKGFILKGVYNLAYEREGLAIQGDFLFSKI